MHWLLGVGAGHRVFDLQCIRQCINQTPMHCPWSDALGSPGSGGGAGGTRRNPEEPLDHWDLRRGGGGGNLVWVDFDTIFAQIEQELRGIPDPIHQLCACDQVYELARNLITITGANGLRGVAANRAIKEYGVREAAKAAGYTVYTLKRVAGR